MRSLIFAFLVFSALVAKAQHPAHDHFPKPWPGRHGLAERPKQHVSSFDSDPSALEVKAIIALATPARVQIDVVCYNLQTSRQMWKQSFWVRPGQRERIGYRGGRNSGGLVYVITRQQVFTK